MSPGQELFWMMPREVRTLVLGNMVFGSIETGKVQDALLAEAMARSLRTVNEEAEASILNRRMDLYQRYQGIGDWIRRTMDDAHDERIFREVLTNYQSSLAEQSFLGVADLLADLPSLLVVGLNARLPELVEAQPRLPRPQGELFAIGQFLGAGLIQLYLPTLAYGVERGLFSTRDFGVAPEQIEGIAVAPDKASSSVIVVDAEHLANLRLFQEAVDRLQWDWGRMHPAVQGYLRVLEPMEWLDGSGANRVRPAAEQVELYLREPRH